MRRKDLLFKATDKLLGKSTDCTKRNEPLSQNPGQYCEASETQGLCHDASCFVLLSSIKPALGVERKMVGGREGGRWGILVWVPRMQNLRQGFLFLWFWWECSGEKGRDRKGSMWSQLDTSFSLMQWKALEYKRHDTNKASAVSPLLFFLGGWGWEKLLLGQEQLFGDRVPNTHCSWKTRAPTSKGDLQGTPTAPTRLGEVVLQRVSFQWSFPPRILPRTSAVGLREFPIFFFCSHAAWPHFHAFSFDSSKQTGFSWYNYWTSTANAKTGSRASCLPYIKDTLLATGMLIWLHLSLYLLLVSFLQWPASTSVIFFPSNFSVALSDSIWGCRHSLSWASSF